MSVAFRSSSATHNTAAASTIAVTIPSAVQVGDFMVAVVVDDGTAASYPTPAGWTALYDTNGGGTGHTFTAYKVAVSGDTGGSTAVSFNASGSNGSGASFAAYSGVGSIDKQARSTGTAAASSGTGATSPAVTPTSGSTVVVELWGGYTSGSRPGVTPPATSRDNVAVPFNGGGCGISDQAGPSGGTSTGTAFAAFAGSSGTVLWQAVTLALSPDVTVTGPVMAVTVAALAGSVVVLTNVTAAGPVMAVTMASPAGTVLAGGTVTVVGVPFGLVVAMPVGAVDAPSPPPVPEFVGTITAAADPPPGVVLGSTLSYVAGKLWLLLGVKITGGVAVQLAAMVYDPTSDTWTTMSSVSSAESRYGHAAMVVGTKIYIFGGQAYPAAYTHFTLVYDTVADTWTPLADPMMSFNPSSIVIAGKIGGLIYVPGTWGSGASIIMSAYDPTSDTWTAKATPSGVSTAGEAVGTKLYVASDGGGTDTVYVYDSGSDTWTFETVTGIGGNYGPMSASRSDGTIMVSGFPAGLEPHGLRHFTTPSTLAVTFGAVFDRYYPAMATIPGATPTDDLLHIVGGTDLSLNPTLPTHVVVSFVLPPAPTIGTGPAVGFISG